MSEEKAPKRPFSMPKILSSALEKVASFETFAALHKELSRPMTSGLPTNQEELFALWSQLWTQPLVLGQFWLEMMASYQREGLTWWQQTMGLNPTPSEAPKERPGPRDRRFQGDAWSKEPAFDFIKRSYLLVSDTIRMAADATPLEGETKERLQYYTQSFVDALSPSNFALTNPEVLEEAAKTGGKSLLDGLQNLIHDVQQGRITLTDETDFAVGRNLATTPGAVVYQNRLFQLIQYAPSTETVHRRPLLIVPPCINKFYILDLKASNSFVKWLTEQGHTVFIVSWINATPALRDVGWDEYVLEGVLEAIDVVREIAAVETINLIAWCIGGTLSATALALLGRRGQHKVESAAFLTTLLDFSDPGQVKVFLTPEEVSKRAEVVDKSGVFSGKQMAMGFNMLRANDLIWSYVVNNYLKGKTPPPFDLLYWNSDPTNLPAKMYNAYIDDFYLQNKLIQRDALILDGTPIALSSIDLPCYFLSAVNDHIAPWKTTYEGARQLSGPLTFVLGGSGHIAGVVNHPSKQKRGYKTNDDLSGTPDQWLAAATAHQGSWWPHWDAWSQSFGGGQIPARHDLGSEQHPEIEPAPGAYVRVNCDGQLNDA